MIEVYAPLGLDMGRGDELPEYHRAGLLQRLSL